MACFPFPASYPIQCSSKGGDWNDQNRQKLGTITNINGAALSRPRVKPDVLLSQTSGVSATFTSVNPVSENGHISEVQVRQNIPTKKQFVDSYRQGVIIEGGVGYRQTVVVRSYEVGPDKTITIESILNLFQVMS